MDLGELIEEFRRRADDVATSTLYDDAALARFATEAEREAAERGRLLYDDTSAGITTYAVVASTPRILLDPAVFDIDAASFTASGGGRALELDLVGIDWIREQPDWQTREVSRPWALAMVGREARLFPGPRVAGTLQLSVYRYPLDALEDPLDEPEIAPEHHEGLIDWMLYRAYSTKDGEAGDDRRAAQALADFTDRFGEREQAGVTRRRRERRRINTRMV